MIATRRIAVRHLTAADYSEICRLEGDAGVKKFTGGPTYVSEAVYRKFISAPLVSFMAVCAKENGRFIGICGFREVNDKIELEIFLLPEAQGDGMGGELFDAMILHCASASPHLRVAGSVSPANARAVRLLVSRGFADTGETVTMKSGIKHSVYVKTS
jgi:RimJ/RimL family protein N-acetyltransferase